MFVVQWDKVHLKDREDEGPFTFQAVLHKNGTIVFNYKDVRCEDVTPKIFMTFHTLSTNTDDFFRFLCQWRVSIPLNIQ